MAAALGSALTLPTLLLHGCALVSAPAAEPKKEVLSKLPPELPPHKPAAATLLVMEPDIEPAFDTTQIAYTSEPYQVAYFSRHEWAQTPSRMLQTLLVQTLQATRRFSAVLTPPHVGRTTHTLRTQVIELIQDFRTTPPTVRLALRVRLSDDAANRLIAQRDISLSEPMAHRNPEAGVVAANEAAAKALQEIARFVLEHAA